MMPKNKKTKIIALIITLCLVFIVSFYLGIILKNPYEKFLWLNKISLKRNSVEVIKNSINNIKNISIKDSIIDYDLYDYMYYEEMDIYERFFLIDYWNYGMLDEDEYNERKLEISITFQNFFNESPLGEKYLIQKINTVSNVDEKIKLLNYLFNIYTFKNKLNEYDVILNNLNDTDTKMQKYIEKSKLDAKDNGLRRRFGY